MLTSMSSVKNCYDNAKAERLFRTIKHEWFFKNSFSSLDELSESLASFINYYNHNRIHAALGYITPVKFKGTRDNNDSTYATNGFGRDFGIGIAPTFGEHHRV